jgi:hypothetical protein
MIFIPRRSTKYIMWKVELTSHADQQSTLCEKLNWPAAPFNKVHYVKSWIDQPRRSNLLLSHPLQIKDSKLTLMSYNFARGSVLSRTMFFADGLSFWSTFYSCVLSHLLSTKFSTAVAPPRAPRARMLHHQLVLHAAGSLARSAMTSVLST